MSNQRPSITEYMDGVRSGNRVMLAKTITLMESTLPADQFLASQIIDKILQQTGNSIRIGISGSPGVGKSTFIEAFGEYVTSLGKKIAVLTIDPSSQLTKGSILGDKTRMENLSKNPLAFIRPSASGEILGGVAGKTREAMLVCEAAGFEVILIETVGVGQSEVAVKNMIDFFLLLMLAGAGDELQGIKKGIMEMADAIVITKADGDNITRATEAQAEYQHAIHLMSVKSSGWTPPVLTSSAQNKTGIDQIWKMILSFKDTTTQSGHFESNRKLQSIKWFNDTFQQLLHADPFLFPPVKNAHEELTNQISGQQISPQEAAKELLQAYHRAVHESKS